MIAFPTAGYCQIKVSVKRKVQNKTNDKIEKTIDDGLNSTEKTLDEGIKKKFGKKKNKGANETILEENVVEEDPIGASENLSDDSFKTMVKISVITVL